MGLNTENALDILLAIGVLVGLLRWLGPRPKYRIRLETKSKRQPRRVRINPLVAKERKLTAELEAVRQQLSRRDTGL